MFARKFFKILSLEFYLYILFVKLNRLNKKDFICSFHLEFRTFPKNNLKITLKY